MLAKSCRVKSAVAQCHLWYLSRNKEIRTLTERIEGLWFDVEYHIGQMELAEEAGQEEKADGHLEQIIRLVTRIKAEAGDARD